MRLNDRTFVREGVMKLNITIRLRGPIALQVSVIRVCIRVHETGPWGELSKRETHLGIVSDWDSRIVLDELDL